MTFKQSEMYLRWNNGPVRSTAVVIAMLHLSVDGMWFCPPNSESCRHRSTTRCNDSISHYPTISLPS